MSWSFKDSNFRISIDGLRNGRVDSVDGLRAHRLYPTETDTFTIGMRYSVSASGDLDVTSMRFEGNSHWIKLGGMGEEKHVVEVGLGGTWQLGRYRAFVFEFLLLNHPLNPLKCSPSASESRTIPSKVETSLHL